MRFVRIIAVAVPAAAITLVACGGGSGSADAAAGADAPSFIDDYCTTVAPCCGEIMTPTDGIACRKAFYTIAGSAPYDPAVGRACLGQLHDAHDNNPAFCTMLPSCTAPFHGTKAPSTPCIADGECLSSADGDVGCALTLDDRGVSMGRCVVELRGKENDQPCNETRTGTTRTSFPLTLQSGTPGSAPPKAFYCDVADGLFCGGLTGRTHACLKPHGAGEACDSHSSGGCTRDTYCTDANICAARLPVGADCTKAYTAEGDGCVADAFCWPVEAPGAKCTARLADGARCVLEGDRLCLSRHCVNGTCGPDGGKDFTAARKFACAVTPP